MANKNISVQGDKMSNLLQKITLRDTAPKFTTKNIEAREPISIEVKEINHIGVSAVELLISQNGSTRSIHIEQHGNDLVLSIASQRDRDLDAMIEITDSETKVSGIGTDDPTYVFC